MLSAIKVLGKDEAEKLERHEKKKEQKKHHKEKREHKKHAKARREPADGANAPGSGGLGEQHAAGAAADAAPDASQPALAREDWMTVPMPRPAAPKPSGDAESGGDAMNNFLERLDASCLVSSSTSSTTSALSKSAAAAASTDAAETATPSTSPSPPSLNRSSAPVAG
jgi:hypothetical protein